MLGITLLVLQFMSLLREIQVRSFLDDGYSRKIDAKNQELGFYDPFLVNISIL